MTFLGLKRGKDFENWASHPYQDFPEVPPPPTPHGPGCKSGCTAGQVTPDMAKTLTNTGAEPPVRT